MIPLADVHNRYNHGGIVTDVARQQAAALTDDELNAYILARLSALGVDLSRLPEEDADAPADQKRILTSARRFLRSTPGAIVGFELDVAGPPPAMYPAEQIVWTDE